MRDLGLFILRLTVGTLLAGHGSQKLFGWFGGAGLKGTRGFMEKLGMRPGSVWGTMASLGETTGGTLTALGFLHPMGPLTVAGAMSVAIRSAHWNKPIWASQGGAELPLTNLAAALAVALGGPGRYSLDRMFGIRLPRWMAALMWLSTIAATVVALRRPELAETVMNKVTQAMTGTMPPSETSDLQVENRAAPVSQDSTV